MKNQLLSVGIVVLLLVLLMAACGPGQQPVAEEPGQDEPAQAEPGEAQPTPEEAAPEESVEVDTGEEAEVVTAEGCGGEIILATNGDSQAVNPLFGTDTGTVWRTDQISEPLVFLDWETLEPIPWLAESWEISENGLTYTFHLREGPQWPDGTPLTAQDFELTLLTILSPDYTGGWQGVFNDLVGAAEVIAGDATELDGLEVVDDKTLRLTLSQPNAAFLTTAARNLKPIPAHILAGEQLTADHPFMENPIGVGPYRLVEWVKDDHLTLEAKDDYWGEPVCAARITDRYITDLNALALALESGDIDLAAPLAPRDLVRMQENPDITVHRPPSSRLDAVYFNFDSETLADPRVRRAIAMSLNLQEFADNVLAGLQNPAYGFLLPASWAYEEDARIPDQDLEEARALFEEAGYDDFSVTIGANAGNTSREQMATYVQAQLGEIGINADVEFTEWSTFITGVTDGDFEMVVLTAFAGIPEPDSLYSDYHTEGATNYGNYSNPEVDRLLEEARAATDIETRRELYEQVQQLLVEDLPRVPAYEYLSDFATRASITNVRPSAIGYSWDAKYWRKN